MGQLNRVIVAFVLFAGCRSRPSPDHMVAHSEAGTTRVEVIPVPDARRNRDGQLLPSQRHMSWLELPSGFATQPGSTLRRGVYEADDIPIEAVRAYLMARVVPGEIETTPLGFSYRRALPSYTRLPMAPLDISVLEADPTRHRVRLIIDDLSPPPEAPLPVDIAAKELARERDRAK